MRRLIIEEPYSQAAVWARRLAVFALLMGAISVILVRSTAVEVVAGLSVFGAAVLLACASLLLAGAGMAVIWRLGRKGLSYVVVAVFLSLGFLAYPGWLAYTAVRLPLINDITTDVNNPPAYSTRAQTVLARSGRTPADMTEGRRLEQQQSYPDIQPIVIDVEAKEGYLIVRQAVRELGWRVIEEASPVTKEEIAAAPPRPAAPAPQPVQRPGSPPVPPQRPQAPVPREPRDGRIDAVERSLVMGLPDDITIRIVALPDQTRIDLRSASRYGRHDFGANAKRIRRFAAELQAQLDADQ